MEAFQLLSRGGVKFDKKRFQADVQLFNGEGHSDEVEQTSGELPPELDFFRYVQGNAPKRKTRQSSSQQDGNDENGQKGKKKIKTDGQDKEEGPPLPSVSQKLVYVADESSKLPTLRQHLFQPYAPPIVIFTSTQPRASSLAEQLVLNGVQNVDCLHAGMSMKEREDAISRMRRGDSWVMISTEIMARGMDFKGVRGVINFDFPTSVQSYIHRIGRTGRAGREGTAITYFTNEDAPFLKPIANVLLQSGSTVPEWILKLPKPSKMKRREMGKVKRGETVTKNDRIGRSQTIKKKNIIEASKRRKARDNGLASDNKNVRQTVNGQSDYEDS